MKLTNLAIYYGVDDSPLKAGDVIQLSNGEIRTVVKTSCTSALIDNNFNVITPFVKDYELTMSYIKEHYDPRAACKSRPYTPRVISSGMKLHDIVNNVTYTITFNSTTNEWWCVNCEGISYMRPYYSKKNLTYDDMVAWFATAGGVETLNVVTE